MGFPRLILIGLAIITWSCKSTTPTTEPAQTADPAKEKIIEIPRATTFIEMERSSCMHECPNYTVKVFEDGWAEFKGVQHTHFIGTFSGRVEPEFNHILWRQVREADLKNKKQHYGLGNEDTQTISIRYSGDDFKKEIVFQSFEPIEINEIERQLKIIAENTPWEKTN